MTREPSHGEADPDAHTEPPLDPRDEIVTHIGPMRAFALTLTGNGSEADDLVQEALVKAWKHIDSFEAGTNMRAWLFTILRNTFYSIKRKAGREVGDPDGIAEETLAVKPAHDGRLQLREFLAAFDQLPAEQREALVLVGASGFSYEEAAGMCGVAVGTIKSRANRGRAHLAKLLDPDGEGYGDITDTVTHAVVAAGTHGRRIA